MCGQDRRPWTTSACGLREQTWALRHSSPRWIDTKRRLEGDVHHDQLGNRAAGLCLCCDRLKRVLVNTWYSGGDGEMDGGDRKAVRILFDDDVRFAIHPLRHEVRHPKHSNERHGEARRMRCAEQLLRIGARSLAITAEERVGMVRHRLALGRDRAFAVTQTSAPGGGSETLHGLRFLAC